MHGRLYGSVVHYVYYVRLENKQMSSHLMLLKEITCMMIWIASKFRRNL